MVARAIGRLASALAAVDWATAGAKTYVGLALIAGGLLAERMEWLDSSAALALEVAGLGLAGVGRAAAARREGGES